MHRRGTLLPGMLALLLLTGATGSDGPDDRPDHSEARAWAVWIHVPGQDVVQIAAASARGGDDPTASAAPVSVAGSAPARARADRETPESVDEGISWLDPTSSMSIDGGSVEARVGNGNASARATTATGSGSGFALADELLTWEQQEQLLGAWGDANTMLFDQLNALAAPLDPVLGPRNLAAPRLEPMTPLGFVDVAGTQHLTARAEAVTSPGLASAAASADVSRVRLFGGFIEVDGVTASALTERMGGVETGRAHATVERIRIAGVEVDTSGDGLVAASNSLLPRDAGQPVLDLAVAGLEAAGVDLRIAEDRTAEGIHQVTALQIELPTPDGMATVSIGHAEAGLGPDASTSAPPAAAPAPDAEPAPVSSVDSETVRDDAGPVAAPANDPPSARTGTTRPSTPSAPTPAARPDVASVASPTTSPEVGAEPAVAALRLLPPPGEQAARSMSLAYLVLVGGVLASGGLIPAVIGTRPHGPRPRTAPSRARRSE